MKPWPSVTESETEGQCSDRERGRDPDTTTTWSSITPYYPGSRERDDVTAVRNSNNTLGYKACLQWNMHNSWFFTKCSDSAVWGWGRWGVVVVGAGCRDKLREIGKWRTEEMEKRR